jgi:hypothetical protein
MRPDLLIIGDSHTAALQQAAVLRDVKSKLLYISGNFWHEGKIRPHADLGLSALYRPPLHRRIENLVAETGNKSLFSRDVPVLASFGYHLGRMVPRFARYGHTPDAQQSQDEKDTLFVSDAFLAQYIHAHRGSLFRLLRFAARHCDLVVVAPPIIQTDPVATQFAEMITDMLLGAGLRVFDPRREVDWLGTPLAPEWRSADQVHGNVAYGSEVLARLFDRGLIGKSA